MNALRLTVGTHTDAGRRRAVNEDSLLARNPVFVVADGMGGHDAGDRASAAVVGAFAPLVGRTVSADEVAATVQAAHTAVAELAATTARGAGSTLTGVIAVEHDGQLRWLVVNVGDSRVYRLLNDRLEQLTVDHSVAQELVDAGELAREDMSRFSGRNVITRAMGEERSPADFWLLPVITGERLLVCSDGLSSEVSDEALRAGLTLGGTAEQTAQALVAQALAAGGRDNITVIVIDVVAGGAGHAFDENTGGMSSADSSTIEVATVQSARRRAR